MNVGIMIADGAGQWLLEAAVFQEARDISSIVMKLVIRQQQIHRRRYNMLI